MYKSNGSLVGKKVYSVTPKKTNFSYRTKATKSHVDETLFGSPNRFLQQVETKRQSQDADWDPPWATGPTSKGAPLLWTSCNLKSKFLINILINLIFLKTLNKYKFNCCNNYFSFFDVLISFINFDFLINLFDKFNSF